MCRYGRLIQHSEQIFKMIFFTIKTSNLLVVWFKIEILVCGKKLCAHFEREIINCRGTWINKIRRSNTNKVVILWLLLCLGTLLQIHSYDKINMESVVFILTLAYIYFNKTPLHADVVFIFNKPNNVSLCIQMPLKQILCISMNNFVSEIIYFFCSKERFESLQELLLKTISSNVFNHYYKWE